MGKVYIMMKMNPLKNMWPPLKKHLHDIGISFNNTCIYFQLLSSYNYAKSTHTSYRVSIGYDIIQQQCILEVGPNSCGLIEQAM